MYGFWLPNDPRGSWSTWVGSWDLYRYGGPATKVNDRRSHAWDEHDVQKRLDLKQHLKLPPVHLSGMQARAVGEGFHIAALKCGYKVYALAVMPEHVHIILGRHSYRVEQMIRILKQQAGLRLKAQGYHPFQAEQGRRGVLPSVFCDGMWKCFIDSQSYFRAAIKYVGNNPVKEGLPRQNWNCVVPYAARSGGSSNHR